MRRWEELNLKKSRFPDSIVRHGCSFAVLALLACSQNGRSYSVGKLPEKSEPEETLFVHGAVIDGGSLFLLTSDQRAPGQDRFSETQFGGMLGLDPADYDFVRLHVFGFDPNTPALALGSDGIEVRAEGASGISLSLRPSTLLLSVKNETARLRLGAELGAGSLPDPRGGHLDLLVVMPGRDVIGSMERWSVRLPDREIALERRSLRSRVLDQFFTRPSISNWKKVIDGEELIASADARQAEEGPPIEEPEADH